MYLDNSVTMSALNTPIHKNSAVNRGGAIAFMKSSLGVFPPTIATFQSNVDVYENTASDGGLIFIDN
jgi:predicted outer membrane repeat protein